MKLLTDLPLGLKVLLGLTLLYPLPILLATLETRHKERPFPSRLYHLMLLPLFVHLAAATFSYAHMLRTMELTARKDRVAVATSVAQAQATLPFTAFIVITLAVFALFALRNHEWGEERFTAPLIGVLAVLGLELLLGWRIAAGQRLQWMAWLGVAIAVACVLWICIAALRSTPVARSSVVGVVIVAAIVVLAVWQVTRVLISVALTTK